jgi:hypothetical protein
VFMDLEWRQDEIQHSCREDLPVKWLLFGVLPDELWRLCSFDMVRYVWKANGRAWLDIVSLVHSSLSVSRFYHGCAHCG